jgi:hypothetical protein
MGNRKNPLKTEQITVSTNRVLCSSVDKVLLTGHYGNNRAEAAERLIAEAIRHLIREGTIVRKGKVIKL